MHQALALAVLAGHAACPSPITTSLFPAVVKCTVEFSVSGTSSSLAQVVIALMKSQGTPQGATPPLTPL